MWCSCSMDLFLPHCPISQPNVSFPFCTFHVFLQVSNLSTKVSLMKDWKVIFHVFGQFQVRNGQRTGIMGRGALQLHTKVKGSWHIWKMCYVLDQPCWSVVGHLSIRELWPHFLAHPTPSLQIGEFAWCACPSGHHSGEFVLFRYLRGNREQEGLWWGKREKEENKKWWKRRVLCPKRRRECQHVGKRQGHWFPRLACSSCFKYVCPDISTCGFF